jgi:L-asparaginase
MNRLDRIAVLSTGGTFNKIYNPRTGELEIDPEAKALRAIAEKWLCTFELHTLIHKDSLEMTETDREELARKIEALPGMKILVVHGTDTIDLSAAYLEKRFGTARQIVLTGAMIPYSFDPVEATANLASAAGWLLGSDETGVRIALHGLVLPPERIRKDRALGRFVGH